MLKTPLEEKFQHCVQSPLNAPMAIYTQTLATPTATVKSGAGFAKAIVNAPTVQGNVQMLNDAQIAELKKPLDPKHVVKPTGQFGPKGDYLEGWLVINELNRVFGFDGWSYTIDLSRDALERVEGKDQWAAAYTCICTLTIGEVTRQDVGFGSGFAKGVGDAIEGATKEAVTDSLKRAARTFGNIFGLALYDKSRVNVSAPPPALIDGPQLDELQLLFDHLNVPVAEFLTKGKIKRLSELEADRFDGAKTWINNRALELRETKDEA
jgi:DNA recombination protein Rad52